MFASSQRLQARIDRLMVHARRTTDRICRPSSRDSLHPRVQLDRGAMPGRRVGVCVRPLRAGDRPVRARTDEAPSKPVVGEHPGLLPWIRSGTGGRLVRRAGRRSARRPRQHRRQPQSTRTRGQRRIVVGHADFLLGACRPGDGQAGPAIRLMAAFVGTEACAAREAISRRAVRNRRRGQRSRFHAAARAANTPRSAAHSP